jgi:arsenate reductase
MTTIWHNPRCSKSRATLALIEGRGITPDIRRYLDDAPSESEIREVLALLDIPAEKLIRKGEALFKELGLKDADEDTLIKAMAENPKLVERPVVIKDGKASLGRPPKAVLDIL